MSDDQPIENIPLSDRYNASKIVGSDLDSLSYARMPVSSFGMSMLTSMGFYEGRGLGRNPENALHHPIEFVPRHHRLGLGADPAPLLLKKNEKLMEKSGKNEVNSGTSKRNGRNDDVKHENKENNEEKSQEKQNKRNLGREGTVMNDNSQRKSKNYVNIGEKPVERKRRKLGMESRVEIVGGKHVGLTGKIISMNEETKEVIVQLELNEENVKVKREEVALEEEDEREVEGVTKKVIHKEKSIKEEKKEKKLKWIMTGLRVRIISKKYHNGKFYNIKVSINDILDTYSFTAVTNNGEVLYSLREKDVETLLPEVENNIMIVKGEKKGQMAVLKSRDRKKNKVMVQNLDDFEYSELTQDDVCECVL